MRPRDFSVKCKVAKVSQRPTTHICRFTGMNATTSGRLVSLDSPAEQQTVRDVHDYSRDECLMELLWTTTPQRDGVRDTL